MNIPSEWTREDYQAAQEEGWFLAIAGSKAGITQGHSHETTIEKRFVHPYDKIFATDEEALAFVQNNPSPLHEKALRLAVIARLES